MGEEFNSAIRVLWTPYICSMERSTNLNYIHDHKLPPAKREPSEAATKAELQVRLRVRARVRGRG